MSVKNLLKKKPKETAHTSFHYAHMTNDRAPAITVSRSGTKFEPKFSHTNMYEKRKGNTCAIA